MEIAPRRGISKKRIGSLSCRRVSRRGRGTNIRQKKNCANHFADVHILFRALRSLHWQMQWIVTDRHVSTLIQTDPVLIEASVPKLCLQWFDFYTVVNISDWRRLELAKERNRPILSHMRDERLIREIWARCRPNALHAMRRGAQF